VDKYIINKKFQRYKITFSFIGNHGQVFRSFKLLVMQINVSITH